MEKKEGFDLVEKELEAVNGCETSYYTYDEEDGWEPVPQRPPSGGRPPPLGPRV